MEQSTLEKLNAYRAEVSSELANIMRYWIDHTVDLEKGEFVGRIDEQNNIVPSSPKGAVLNARILWSFSAAYNLDPNPGYLEMARRAYQYIVDHFIDRKFGGVYWSVDADGNKLDTKKQVYAIAFTVYGLAEYYKASGYEQSLTDAIELYELLVAKSFDPDKTGYFEAFTEDWQPIADLRLSDKDANEKKTANTHLHVLEGYTNLYRVWPDDGLRKQIGLLIANFIDHFIDAETGHLRLFFDEDWNSKSTLISYGHDIETTWLLLEAAEVIGDNESIEKIKSLTKIVAQATLKGFDTDGGLWYEYEPEADHLVAEKHWWVQAEAMVGFFNAWQITGDEQYLNISIGNWHFVKNHILDKQHGEWLWGIRQNGSPMPGEDKVGMWKCPYHNSRACMEIIRRTT